MKNSNIFILSLLLLPLISACGETSVDDTALTAVNERGPSSGNQGTQLLSSPQGELSQLEIDGLIYMREEEKLAHDIYIVLYDTWGQNIFINIAASETTHTEAILQLLNNYGIDDPVEDNAIGVFTDPGLQSLNDALVDEGSASLNNALLVGAAIEEIDMLDIQLYIDQVEGNDDIVQVYENLLKGSRNHLRSFVSNLDSQGITYSPQYMDDDDYDDIINSPMEKG